MPTPYAAGETIDTAAVLNAFVTQVRNFAITSAPYHSGSYPGGFAPQAYRLGPSTIAGESWSSPNPAPVHAQAVTTNMFYILHHFAMKLTRIRRGRFILKHGEAWYGMGNAASYFSYDQITGYTNVAYANGNVIGFDIPAVPAPVATPPSVSQYPFDAAQLNAFLGALRTAVNNIQSDNSYSSDFTACHNNCHTSCHGSRGRR